MVQTYNPENDSIVLAKKQDYNTFYKSEINIRNQLKYPPFCDIILININGVNSGKVKNVSIELYNILNKSSDRIKVLNPLPSPISKIKGKYRWRIIVKCKFNDEIIELVNNMLKIFDEMKEKDIRLAVDVNPSSMI